jgi:hypothetical protein
VRVATTPLLLCLAAPPLADELTLGGTCLKSTWMVAAPLTTSNSICSGMRSQD